MNPLMTEGDAIVHADELTAAYDLMFRKQSEDWVAIGSITSETMQAHKPVWLIVGIGKLPADAVARLQCALDREAIRIASWSNACVASIE